MDKNGVFGDFDLMGFLREKIVFGSILFVIIFVSILGWRTMQPKYFSSRMVLQVGSVGDQGSIVPLEVVTNSLPVQNPSQIKRDNPNRNVVLNYAGILSWKAGLIEMKSLASTPEASKALLVKIARDVMQTHAALFKEEQELYLDLFNQVKSKAYATSGTDFGFGMKKFVHGQMLSKVVKSRSWPTKMLIEPELGQESGKLSTALLVVLAVLLSGMLTLVVLAAWGLLRLIFVTSKSGGAVS